MQAATAHLFIDYQNLHLSGNETFGSFAAPLHKSLIHPGKFADRVEQLRNSKVHLPVAITEVHVYRGQPSSSRDAPLRQNKFFESAWAPARRLANGLPPFGADQWIPQASGVWAGRTPAKTPLGKWPRVHDLRHSHASWLLAEGKPIQAIANRLGHESAMTTLNVYGHIADEQVNALGDTIGLVLSGAMPEIES